MRNMRLFTEICVLLHLLIAFAKHFIKVTNRENESYDL